jgi:branched-chain amino acid aminotransferase
MTAPATAPTQSKRTSKPVPQIWIDGKYYEKHEARISVFDHGLLYGDGVFEGIRAYKGKVFRLRQHVERLYASAKAVALEIPMSKQEMEGVVLDGIKVNGLAESDAYIRLVVTRGVGDLGLDPRKCARATVFCISDAIALWPRELYERGLSMVTVPTPTSPSHNLSPAVKSLNYLAHIMAKVEATNAGADEALMLEGNGFVAEASGMNVFCVNSRVLRTPPEHAGILRGITRGAVIELAGAAGLDIREEQLTRYDFYNADEAFLTGTAAEIVGVVRIDGRVIGSGSVGPVTREMSARFRALAERGG